MLNAKNKDLTTNNPVKKISCESILYRLIYVKKIKRAYNDIIISLITHISGPTGRKIRYWYWKKRFKKCGKNVFIDEGVIIQNPEWISVGDNVWIDRYCVLLAGKPDEKKSSKVFYIKENPDYKYERGELVI
ncbi:MAG: hypothetical protein ACUVUQ_11130, partial [Thermodesulfovibrionales bacterium]